MRRLEHAAPSGLSDFAGAWHLQRRIDDATTGQVIEGEGRADLIAEAAGGSIYSETVRLAFPGQPMMTGTRRYLWRGDAQGIAVMFDDGRAFHRIALGVAMAEDLHLCTPDTYTVRYDFSDWPVWSAHWTVRGPRKDYVMSTTYRRA